MTFNAVSGEVNAIGYKVNACEKRERGKPKLDHGVLRVPLVKWITEILQADNEKEDAYQWDAIARPAETQTRVAISIDFLIASPVKKRSEQTHKSANEHRLKHAPYPNSVPLSPSYPVAARQQL
jgi:hypothetical protein